MTEAEIENVLATMSVLVDNREQPNRRAENRYKTFGVPFFRTTLNYGDYTYNAEINGKLIYDLSETIKPDVVVERKMSLEELSGCFTEKRESESKELGVRNRFEKELFRAKQNNAKVYLLVEDSTWEKLILGNYNTKFNATSYLASLTAYQARYDLSIIFCKHETSGKLIKEILYRELKEKLRNGVYG